MRAFVDTSALLALAARQDAHHQAAVAFRAGLPRAARLLTSDYVFDETMTRLRRIDGHAAAVRVGEALRASKMATIERISEAELEAAWKLFVKYRDQPLSFTDCTVAAMAQARRLPVFAFDDDFRRIGLQVLPQVPNP
ncbi:MAG: type II toxin-antitoxin system VapC family toxin [Thermoplasmatota archaeon]